MNKRVYNALRKIATESKPENFTEEESWNYYTQLPWVDAKNQGAMGANRAKDQLLGYPKYGKLPTIEQIRQLQARDNAKHIAPFGTDKYFDTLKHLLNYGRTKQYNFTNPDNSRPLPVYSGTKLTEDELKKLRELENIQANNRRQNPYANIG